MYDGTLILKEIPYGKRRIKWSYDVIEDKSGVFSNDYVLPSRVVLREIIKGTIVQFVDEKGEVITVKKSLN